MTPELERTRAIEDGLVVEELRSAGVFVDSVFDLVNDRGSHPKAVEALLRVLPRISDSWIKQGVVRALTDPAARGVAARPLVDEFRTACNFGEESLAWAIGNALVTVADDSVLEDLLELARNVRCGRGRQTIALALARFKRDPRVTQTLLTLLDDDQTAAHALVVLRKIKAAETIDRVRGLTAHKNRLIRREAERTLKVFERLRSFAVHTDLRSD